MSQRACANRTTRWSGTFFLTEGIQWNKAALSLLVSRWSVSFEFTFCGGKTRFTHAMAANKPANSHNFKIKNLNLLTITFLAVYIMNRGKSSLNLAKFGKKLVESITCRVYGELQSWFWTVLCRSEYVRGSAEMFKLEILEANCSLPSVSWWGLSW